MTKDVNKEKEFLLVRIETLRTYLWKEIDKQIDIKALWVVSKEFGKLRVSFNETLRKVLNMYFRCNDLISINGVIETIDTSYSIEAYIDCCVFKKKSGRIKLYDYPSTFNFTNNNDWIREMKRVGYIKPIKKFTERSN